MCGTPRFGLIINVGGQRALFASIPNPNRTQKRNGAPPAGRAIHVIFFAMLS